MRQWHDTPDRIRVRVEKLSEKSRRSYMIPGYWETAEERCIGCHSMFKITAKWQRDQYEEMGRYVWARPNKCPQCFAEWRELRERVKQFPAALRGDPQLDMLLEMKRNLTRFWQLQPARKDCALAKRIENAIKANEWTTPKKEKP